MRDQQLINSSLRMDFKKHQTKIAGRSFTYWQKNPRAKNTCIILHGFPGNHLGLVQFARQLGPIRIIMPDLPACGESDQLLLPHTLENFAAWLNEFYDALGISQASVIGHSFGARLASRFGSMRPDRIERLVLITPVVRVDGWVAQLAAWEYSIAGSLSLGLRRAWLTNGLTLGVTNMMLYESSGKKVRAELIAIAKAEADRVDPRVSVELFQDFLRDDLSAAAKNIKARTLIVAGDRDRIAPLASVKEFARQFSSAKLDVMARSGHMAPLERPRATASIINAWL